MGKLLTILGANEEVQQLLPADLFQAEKVIIGLQEIYSQAPDSPKKNQLAIAISEAVRIMMARLNPYLVKDEVEEKTEEEEKKLPDEKEAPRVRKEQPKPPMPPEIPETPEDKPEDQPKPEDEEPKTPKKGKPQKPKAPEPPTPSPHKKVEEEPMTCEEIKAAINGLILLVKMGDSEAKEIVKVLKNKYKTQNCK